MKEEPTRGAPHGPSEIQGLILTYLREQSGQTARHLLARISAPRTAVMAGVRALSAKGRIRRVGDAVPFAWEIDPDHAVERTQAGTKKR